MVELTVNGEVHQVSGPTSVAELLDQLGYDRQRIAVELNRRVLPVGRQREALVKAGDSLEIVRLVGGGSGAEDIEANDALLQIGTHRLGSRLITGTGKYASYDLMRECLDASGCEVTTVAVRRERLMDTAGRNILDYLDLSRYCILPNTAGCFSADDAVRHALLARELLTNLRNPGADWVKLECLGDRLTLWPDAIDTIAATERLVVEGLQVLAYTGDDPIVARRLRDAGATCVMPAGSPIGSGQGVLNPNQIRLVLEAIKKEDPSYPVIVDAGVGTASDVAIAMELGCDGVLLNTAIAQAEHPVQMARAMRYACLAGRQAYLAGRIPRKRYAQASSPMEGRIES
jgi:thiazole synthase